MTKKTKNLDSSEVESEEEDQKPGDNPPEHKRKEADSREGKTFAGRGKELRK